MSNERKLSVDEQRDALKAAGIDGTEDLTDDQVETAYAEKLTAPARPARQPREASKPSTGAHIASGADEAGEPDPDAPKPTVGRIVLWTQETRDGPISLPAIVTGTVDHPEGAFGLELDSPWHVHLTVFEPGVARGHSATNVEWNGTGTKHGTWRWPERV